jgi:hypothetical protein
MNGSGPTPSITGMLIRIAVVLASCLIVWMQLNALGALKAT